MCTVSQFPEAKSRNAGNGASIDEFVAEMRGRAERDPRVRFCLEKLLELDGPAKANLNLVARNVNLSQSRLRHVFCEVLGISPFRLLKTVQIKRAKVLLNGSFLSVKEVMFRVGINDPSHFARDYERLVGEQPSSTRKRRLQLANHGQRSGLATKVAKVSRCPSPGKG
jgi:AraC-like DNA-binding protein